MNQLSHLPQAKQTVLDRLVNDLSSVPGIRAVVLGGSYASRTQRAGSDMDIGLYYRADAPFEIGKIRQVAEKIAVRPPTVTQFYAWGGWVNGGAWIQTAAGKVDFLYRNLDQVERAIHQAQKGIVEHDYLQQPTHGFYSIIYLAETQICIPLHDPSGQIARLKQMVKEYPPRLKEKFLVDSLWSAEFSLLHASNFAKNGDVYNTVGCLTRISSSLTQALFALNETYFINDKCVMDTIAGFAILPDRYIEQITGILAYPGETESQLSQTVDRMHTVWKAVVDLPGVNYQPRFRLS